MNELIGYISAIAFAIMALPQIITIILKKEGNGTSWGFVILNYIGNLCAIYYIFNKDALSGETHYPLYLNYSIATLNLVILSILKIKYRRPNNGQQEIQQRS